MRKTTLFGAVFACILASSVAADQIGYLCDVADKGDGGFVNSPVTFVFDPEKKDVIISDPLIVSVKGRPVAGKLKRRGTGVYRVRWRVSAIPTIQATTTASYTAIIDLQKNSVRITGRITGAVNRLDGTGTCKLLKQGQINQILRS